MKFILFSVSSFLNVFGMYFDDNGVFCLINGYFLQLIYLYMYIYNYLQFPKHVYL